MHSPVPSNEIIEALIHIRDLFRRIRPSNERELRALERREAATKDLLSNLPRTNENPTLRALVEIAEICSLTSSPWFVTSDGRRISGAFWRNSTTGILWPSKRN